MHPATALRGRDTLQAMSACFIDEVFGSFALDIEGYRLKSGTRIQSLGRVALSSLAVGHFQIGISQLGDEDHGVLATLSGTYLNAYFGHLTSHSCSHIQDTQVHFKTQV
jgi:hypothetical protein